MSETTNTPGTSLAGYSDDVIRGFLLGRLNATEQLKFEEQLMLDDRLEESVRLAEYQLADDYILDRIDLDDRHRYLETFLVTPERRRLTMVSTVLRDHFRPSNKPSSPWSLPNLSWRNLFDFNRIAWRYAFGVVILLLLVASFLLVTKESRIVKRILPKRLPARPAAVSSPQEANHPTGSAAPLHRETASPLPAHESTLPKQAVDSQIVATIVLSAGVESEISLPDQAAGTVRLQMAVEPNESSVFRAELLSGSSSVFVTEELKAADDGVLNFDIPVQNLTAGDYQVKLSRVHDRSEKPLAGYSFRVR